MIAALKSSVFEGVYVQDKTVHPFNLWIVMYAATQSAYRALHHNERDGQFMLFFYVFSIGCWSWSAVSRHCSLGYAIGYIQRWMFRLLI